MENRGLRMENRGPRMEHGKSSRSVCRSSILHPRFSILVFSFLFFGFLLCGCGSDLVKVDGVLTLDDKPLGDAILTFFPQESGRSATAVTDAQGAFRLELHPGAYK